MLTRGDLKGSFEVDIGPAIHNVGAHNIGISIRAQDTIYLVTVLLKQT